jgi:D-alanyl-D-alanine carboxypeptidase (penicillin-binding protein 5/6)
VFYKKISFKALCLTTSLLITAHAIATQNTVIAAPTQSQQPIFTPGVPNIDAKGYILIDASSGNVLAEKNADEHMAPASLTKLMTLYIISTELKNGIIRLDDKVRISTKAWRTGGSRMFIKAGDDVTIKDLMQGIIVASGNDATVAMSEHIAGTEEAFVNMMNTQAKNLSMNNSHFIDSTGLPNPQQYSTPRDLAKLAQAITQQFPEDYRLFSQKWFNYNGIRQPNRNRLLWQFQYADGLKTGHTDDAGYCLVASAVRNGTRLISVIMGAPSDQARSEDSIRLLTYGFRFFETHKVYNAPSTLALARVWKGQNKAVPVGLANDFYITLPVGQYKNIQTTIQLNDPLKAPIAKGEVCGTLLITVNNHLVASQPLVALENNAKGGIWRRVNDSFSFSFNKLFSRPNEKVNNG